MEKTNNRDFKVLNDREHVLQRSGMYIGGTKLVTQEQWIIDQESGKMNCKNVDVVPGLLKIFNEIIDNSIDVAIDTNFERGNKIKVNIDSKSVTVTDNGIGIPVKAFSKDDPRTIPEIAWTTLRSGTSFGDNREKIGTNGLGSVATNIFSKVFNATSDDGKKKQTVKCSDNMSVIKCSKITPSSGKSGVDVYFEPDLERFGMKEIDKTHQDMIYQRLFNLAISFPKIKFYFNGAQIVISEKKFAKMFSEDAVFDSNDNMMVCVFPNEHDEFKFYSQVNGLNTFRGGSHVDYITNEVTTRVRDKLVRKFKNIRPGDIKNKMCIAVILTHFKNPEFDSQSKENLKNAYADIAAHINGKFDFDAFAKTVLKTEAIIEPIVETFKIKEELKARQELKKVKKVKVRSDKYMSSFGEQKWLALCEGASAMSGISASLGRDGFAFYAMRGMPLNAYSSNMQKIVANQELKDIINILDLDITKSDSPKTINFDHVLITTDADADGSHLTSMLIGWFKRFSPNLFNEGKLCKLITPLIIIEDNKGKILQYFFNVADFKEFEKKQPNFKGTIRYLKGLGSWEREQLIALIDTYGFENFVVEYHLDNEGEVYIEDWLGDDAEKRKKYLREYTFDINAV